MSAVPAEVTAALRATHAEIVAWWSARPIRVRPKITLKDTYIKIEAEGFGDVSLRRIDAVSQRHGLNWRVFGTLDDWICGIRIWPTGASRYLRDQMEKDAREAAAELEEGDA